MFDSTQQFFPTPSRVTSLMWLKAEELLRGVPREVFDPSAGKGDLLKKPLVFSCYNLQTYAVEIDLDLQIILREDHKVIGSDFLTFDEPIDFECVLMNPPFNEGVHHALKAWNFVRPGGVIVGLLNLQTLANPSTKERTRLLSLIEGHGGWENLEDCFSDAERKTGVNVAMFWMKRPKKVINPNEFKFSGNFQTAATETFDEFAKNPLACTDAVDALVAQYRLCLQLLRTRSEVQSELDYHLSSLPGLPRSRDKVKITFDQFEEVQDLKYQLWQSVFKMTRLGEVSTSDFRRKFEQFVRDQVRMEFNRSNILEALAMFFQNKEQIIIDSVCSVFDQATAYHENNKVHREGWKTNSGWKVNKTIIIPSGIRVSEIWHDWDVSYGAYARTFYDDLDEVLCRLSEVPTNEVKFFCEYFNDAKLVDVRPGVWHDLRFYRVKLFKKGTVHIQFTDQSLLDDLNAIVAKERCWLGGDGF